MTSPDLHPDLEEVLRDIAADPKAKLLRVPSSTDLVRAIAEPAVGVMAPGLRAAERHLLQVHREEVAFLLRERCVMGFFADPKHHLRISRSVTTDRVLEAPEECDWRRRASDSVSADLCEPGSPELGALNDCLDDSKSPSVSKLAVISNRLAPSHRCDLYLAQDLCSRGRGREALSVCRKLVEGGGRPLTASFAWQIAGCSLGQLGRLPEAMEASRRAATVHAHRPASQANWVVFAALCGDEASLRDARAELDHEVAADHIAVDAIVTQLSGAASPPSIEERSPLAQAGLGDPSSASERILHALQH